MKEIFLSASVPVVGRGDYHETANAFLIQWAVRELVVAVIKDRKLVWGGHPAITPMIWAICNDLGVEYGSAVVLYQSRYFSDRFPEENERFQNVIYVDEVAGDREASLLRMRQEMLSRPDLEAAVFIGGMEGVEVEYALFQKLNPEAATLIVPAPGGAALQLAKQLGGFDETAIRDVDFARLFRTRFPSSTTRH